MKLLLITCASLALLSGALLEVKQIYMEDQIRPKSEVRAGCLDQELEEWDCEGSTTLPNSDGQSECKSIIARFTWGGNFSNVVDCDQYVVKDSPKNTGKGAVQLSRAKQEMSTANLVDVDEGYAYSLGFVPTTCPSTILKRCIKVGSRDVTKNVTVGTYTFICDLKEYIYEFAQEIGEITPNPLPSVYLLVGDCDETGG